MVQWKTVATATKQDAYLSPNISELSEQTAPQKSPSQYQTHTNRDTTLTESDSDATGHSGSKRGRGDA